MAEYGPSILKGAFRAFAQGENAKEAMHSAWAIAMDARAVAEMILSGIAGINLNAPMPVLCDLSTDRSASAILNAWAKQPWTALHSAALTDRMEELGYTKESEHVRHFNAGPWIELRSQASRRKVRRTLRGWRDNLVSLFGDFRRNTNASPKDTGRTNPLAE